MNRKGYLSLALALALLLCLIPAAAWADSTKAEPSGAKAAPLSAEDVVINDAGETLYNGSDTVINNFGTVYNNGGIVYNNGGVVFNNGGTVYNNGGIVYNNGAQVYNNDGIVYNNDGSVEDNASATAMTDGTDEKSASEKDPAADEAAADVTGGDTASAAADAGDEKAADDTGVYTLELAGDYSALADFNGFDVDADGNCTVTAKSVCTITPKIGLTITDAVTTAGACSTDADGVITLERVDRDGRLTLKFKVDMPVLTPETSTYCDDVDVRIIAADGTDIYYTLDGSTPTTKSKKYDGEFEIDRSTVVRAIAVMDGAAASDIAEASYIYPAIRDISFGSAAVGYKQPEAIPLVVKNTGLGELVVKSVKLTGSGKDSFILSTGDGGTVASGQSDNKTWTVTPKKGLAAGTYKAEAEFTFDSGDTLDVDISFTVTKAAAKKA